MNYMDYIICKNKKHLRIFLNFNVGCTGNMSRALSKAPKEACRGGGAFNICTLIGLRSWLKNERFCLWALKKEHIGCRQGQSLWECNTDSDIMWHEGQMSWSDRSLLYRMSFLISPPRVAFQTKSLTLGLPLNIARATQIELCPPLVK